jgi:hypothetical protein
LVRVFECPSGNAPSDACSPSARGTELVLTGEHSGLAIRDTTNSEGTIEFFQISEGSYELELADGEWCAAEASAANDDGSIVVEAASVTQVNIFLC